jgi:hypothetical protein
MCAPVRHVARLDARTLGEDAPQVCEAVIDERGGGGGEKGATGGFGDVDQDVQRVGDIWVG